MYRATLVQNIVMKNTGKILVGLSAIFATGIIVGALYAPDKGERTRRRITRKGRSVFNTARDTYEEGQDAVLEIRDNLKEKIEQMNDEIDRLQRC